MQAAIERTLVYEHPERGKITVGQHQIANFEGPVVVLSDPGMGKTFLCEALGGQPGMTYVRAGSFTRNANPASLLSEGDRIVVDGLDEVASAVPEGAIDSVLSQLSAAGSPPFILSCREADWLGAADRVKIADDYRVPPVLLHLQPFTRDDARTFLSHEFPETSADGLLSHLATRGLEPLYGNPLTLRMLGEVDQAKDPLPDTRAELFDRACRVMLAERNPRHQTARRVKIDADTQLLTAGAICATQILCDRIGVYTGPHSDTPNGFLHVSDVGKLPCGKAADDLLKSRLFQADGENRSTHIHRVIAEYLGARWLAQRLESGVSENRIVALFRHGGGVPTSLRGLHAWTAHFSRVIADRFIAADPYAVLRYGNAEILELEQARALLAGLAELSEEDPYFRSEDWGQHPASGLMRPELRDEIVSIIQRPGCHTQLTVLLLEAMVGTLLAPEIAPVLEAIMYDASYSSTERVPAWEALHQSGCISDRDAVIRRLLDMNDSGSARIACHILGDVGMNVVTFDTCVETVLRRLGFGESPREGSAAAENRYPLDRLCSGLDTRRRPVLLDTLVKRVDPSFEHAEDRTRADVADLVRHLAVQVLEHDPTIEPSRLWSWIGRLDHHLGYDLASKKKLAKHFREHRALRTSIQKHVLLTPCGESTWLAGFRLGDVGLGLYPNADDIAVLLRTLREEAGDGPTDTEKWRGLLLHGRSSGGLAPALRATATWAANGDPELLAVLNECSNPVEPEWSAKRERHERARVSKREQAIQAHRNALAARTQDIAAGEIGVLSLPAAVYLYRRFMLDSILNFDQEASPEARLRAFLGASLCQLVLGGFVAVLQRDDLPNASEIVRTRCESDGYCPAEFPMIAGVLELLRTGRPLQAVVHETLAAAYTAWQLTPEIHDRYGIDVGGALEEVLFESEADWEMHFRMSVELQLAHNPGHVYELFRLTTEPQFVRLAGRLAVEWLRRFPALPSSVQSQLLACAVEHGSRDAVRALAIDRRTDEAANNDLKPLWLSAGYAVDFDHCQETLRREAASNRDLLWSIRDRVAPGRRECFTLFGVSQLAFIVEAFATQWRNIGHPTGTVMTGNRNPSNASEFIRGTIGAIAGRPSPEATSALEALIAGHAPTYRNALKHALAAESHESSHRFSVKVATDSHVSSHPFSAT